MSNIFEHEKTVEITKEDAPWAPDEEIGTYHLTRWRWYDKQNCLANSAVVVDEEKDKAVLDMGEYYTRMMRVCVEPPEGLTWNLDRIRSIDPEVGEIITSHLRELNGLTWKEKRGFLPESEEQENTTG